MTSAEKLKAVIESQRPKIRQSFSGPSYHAIQHIVRRLDVMNQFYPNSNIDSPEKVLETQEFFNFGWANALKPFYADLDLNEFRPFPLIYPEDISWADSAIIFAGKLGFCKQVLDYEKAKLVEIISPKENEFGFRYYNQEIGVEYFDRVSANFFRDEIIERWIEEKKAKKPFDENKIREQVKSIIQNPLGKLISYATTPEIDEYYNEVGHYHMLRLQGYDNFDTKDEFGSIQYWKYIDLIELIIGVAYMHRDACMELVNRNPNVDMHNILSYTYQKDKTIKIYSNYLGVSDEEIENIISCFTLSKDNFEYYLSYPYVQPPIYFQVSNNMIIRSIAGCMGNPIRLLNNELKRKYKRDYDIAVTKREERFRKELFYFFQPDRIVKIPTGINITINDLKTDIDAIVYDTNTKTLGLFQLKWQDPFAHSMQERFSRISNLFPKAQEWIDKVKAWTENNNAKTILNSLQITKYAPQATEINEIFVFVISRNHMHFTGVKTDDSVAWGSWYQVIESVARIKTTFDDPIRAMFVKLKSFSPDQRMTREDVPSRLKLDFKFSDYRVYDFV